MNWIPFSSFIDFNRHFFIFGVLLKLVQITAIVLLEKCRGGLILEGARAVFWVEEQIPSKHCNLCWFLNTNVLHVWIPALLLIFRRLVLSVFSCSFEMVTIHQTDEVCGSFISPIWINYSWSSTFKWRQCSSSGWSYGPAFF